MRGGGRGGYGRGGYQKIYQSQSQYANNDMRLQGHGKQGYLKQAGFQNEQYYVVPSSTMVMGGYQSAVPVYGQAQRLLVPSEQLSTLQFADGGIAQQQYLQQQMPIYGMQGLGQTAVMGGAGSGGYVSRGQQRLQPVYYVANPGTFFPIYFLAKHSVSVFIFMHVLYLTSCFALSIRSNLY